jgi:exopolyphosphatase/guanosine-5'-triphosphate,3'-diphosphate pyrophosphatase
MPATLERQSRFGRQATPDRAVGTPGGNRGDVPLPAGAPGIARRYAARDVRVPRFDALITDSSIAAIDLGSNSFRLEIGRVAHGQIERVEYVKEMVRLGGGLDSESRLSTAAMQRGWDCLARFAERVRGFAPQHVRAVATQTFREARNRDEFLVPAHRVLGFPIEVISGREEARLIYSGVAHLLPESDERRLVVDIGGRSTELVLGRGYTPRKVESYPVGSVNLSLRHFGDGRFTPQALNAATLAAQAVLEDALGFLHDRSWDVAYGSSGTVGAIADILAARSAAQVGESGPGRQGVDGNGNEPGLITPQGLDWLAEQLLRAGHVERLRLDGLKDERRAVIGGGVATLRAVFALAGLQAMHDARGALRHGVLYEMLDRDVATHDVRERTVRRLQQKFGVDPDQAERVREAALHLYAQLVPRRDRAAQQQARKLGWAADVHEIGRAVAHDDYHRHGAYILEHSDGAGFALHQLQRLGRLVLAQRGGLRKAGPWLDDEPLCDQLLGLRLAVLLCHARRAPSLEGLKLTRRPRGYRLDVAAAWAERHPRSLVLLGEEAEHWRRVDRVFEVVVG